MFERFTDRSRRVLVLAQEEASLLDHNFIGTEHVLLGLIHEDEGLAALALKSLGVTYDVVFEKVEETIGQQARARTGSPPFTPRSKKVLELSLREAMQLGHDYIGTEHILLGLLREGHGVGVQILQSLGADPLRLRERMLALMGGKSRESYGAERQARTAPGWDTVPTSHAQPNASGWARFPKKILPGPHRSLGSDGLELRVVGVLVFNEGLQLHWRLRGIPESIAKAMRDPSFSPAVQDDRSVAFVALRDDVGTDYIRTQLTMATQSDDECSGSSFFSPSPPESTKRIAVIWQGESLDVAITELS